MVIIFNVYALLSLGVGIFLGYFIFHLEHPVEGFWVGGLVAIAIDLGQRFLISSDLPARLIHPRAGGHLFFIPVWGVAIMVMFAGLSMKVGVKKTPQPMIQPVDPTQPAPQRPAPKIASDNQPVVAARSDETRPPQAKDVRPPQPKGKYHPSVMTKEPVAKSPPIPGLVKEITLPKTYQKPLGFGYSADGRTLVVGMSAGKALWIENDSDAPVNNAAVAGVRPNDPTGCAISPAGDMVAFYKHGFLLYLRTRDNPDSEVILSPAKPGSISQSDAAFSPDGKFLCTAHGTSQLKIWDVTERNLVQEVKGFSGQVAAIAFSPDGSLLVASDGAGLSFRDTKTYKSLGQTPRPGMLSPRQLSFSPDGTLLVGIADKTLYVWKIDNPSSVGTPREVLHLDRLSGARFAANGSMLITATIGGKITAFKTATLEKEVEVPVPGLGETLLAVRPTDGLIAACGTGKILLFDVDKMKPANEGKTEEK